MGRRIVRHAWVVAVLAVVGLLFTASAAIAAPTVPYDRTECVQCHDENTGAGATSKVDFVVPTVDYTACYQCHWIPRTAWVPGSTFKHSHSGPQGCRGCHGGTYLYSDPTRIQQVSTAFGYFNRSDSPSSTPETIHAIHINGSWPKIGAVDPNWCGSCHAPTSCDTCHTGFDAAKHSDHTWNPVSSSYGYPPVAYGVAGGTVPGNMPQASAHLTSSTCINSACHDPAGTIGPANTPDCVSCHPTKSNAHGAESIDHVADQTATVDTSMPASAAWTSATPTGKTCGGCHDMAVTIEHSRPAAVTAALGCGACHDAGGTGAGDKEASHTLTPPTGWAQTCGTNFWCHKATTPQERHIGYTAAHVSASSTCAGGGCHDISNVANIHANATQTVAGWPDNGGIAKSCNVCHRKGYDGASTTCESCHAGHGDLTAVHSANPASPTANPSSACIACHEVADVRTVHTAKGCSVCHNNASRIPNIKLKDANCASCHDKQTDALSPRDYFPVDGEHYTSNLTTHTANETGFEGGKACGTCHYLDMEPEHTRASNAPTWSCVQCHEISVDPWAGTPWSKRCGACHTGATAQHTGMATGHASATSQCSGAQCHDLSDVSTIHSAAATTVAGIGALTSCNVCHYDKDRIFGPIDGGGLPTRKTTDCVTCHSSVNVATHGKHALNRASSDASLTAVTGCTNSGAGCHGADTTSTPNYQTPYHPASGCATGPCHTSASKATKTPPITCQGCHDGTYTNAVHVDSLATTTALGGHYNETTHTAASMNATVPGLAGGRFSASCANCHNATTGTGLKQLSKQHQNLPAPYVSTNCFDCHNYNAAVSAVVSSSWAGKACSACHNGTAMPSNSQHTTSAAPIALATSPLACVQSGCHTTWNLHELHKGDASTGATLTAGGCAVTGCHDFTAQAKKPTTKTCGQGTTGCHTNKNESNHGGTHDLTLAASTYNNTTVTGCLSAGAGCHVTTSTINYQPYHPASGCTTGPCHLSAGKATHINPLTCQACHDKSYAGAAGVATLTATTGTNGGHYSETSHTAVATNTTGLVTSGGTASATCSNCHAGTGGGGLQQLYKQHQSLPAPYTNTTCSDCHNRNAAMQAVVTTKWPTKRCDACHNASVMSTMTIHPTTAPSVASTSALSCGASGTNCHTSTDLHSLHRNAAGGCALSGCHNYSAQATKPVFKGCGLGGNCHVDHTTTTHGLITGNDTTHTAGAVQSADTAYQTTACSSCHSMQLTVEHTRTTS
ncbi:MAG: hypothetical protein Q7W30_00765, partial [Coriobacteriia bacterium]|nr:hypothetical protein [Coriobacteriia bacterium]